MITLRQITYFEALARTLHFGRAAEQVHVSQPALSTQIAELETKLNRKLIERGRGALMLTEAGERLLPAFRRILAEVRTIEEQVLQDTGVLASSLRVGMIPTVAPYLLPALAPILQTRFPKLEFAVKEAVTETLVTQLKTGALDAIIAAMPINEQGIAHLPLFEDRFFMAVSNNDRDVLASPLNQHQIALDRLLLLEEGHCLRDQALALCDERPTANLVNFGATSLTTLLQMVAHGMGRTLLPEIAVAAEAPNRGDIRILAFAPPAPTRQIAMFYRAASERRQDHQAFAETVREVASSILAGARGSIAA